MDLLARFVGIMMMFVIYIAVDVEGVAYDATCSGTGAGNCDEANNMCVAGTLKCACATNSFRKGGTECATKIALTKACTTGQPADQCADSNAACDATASKCQCKTAHFVSKKTGACKPVVPALDGACDVSDSASDQCAVAHSECKNKGTDKCLCKATHYVKGAACAIRILPGDPCTADQCVTHASCNTTSNKCQCETGYTATPTAKPTMCSGVTKVSTLSYMLAVPIFVSMMFLLR